MFFSKTTTACVVPSIFFLLLSFGQTLVSGTTVSTPYKYVDGPRFITDAVGSATKFYSYNGAYAKLSCFDMVQPPPPQKKIRFLTHKLEGKSNKQSH